MGRLTVAACSLTLCGAEHQVWLHVSSLGEESGFRGWDGFEQRGQAVGVMAGASGAAGRDRRDGVPGQRSFPVPSNMMLLGLLVSHPGLAWCCAPQ